MAKKRRTATTGTVGPVKAGAARAGRWRLAASVAALVALVSGAAHLRARGTRAVSALPTSTGAPAPSAPAPTASADEAGGEDWLPGRSVYAGSRHCAECHAKNHDRWSRDWHAKALAEAKPGAVVGNFDGFHFRGASSEAWMARKGAGYVVRTADRDGRLGDYPVEWVIGGKRMQDPLAIFPDGRWQVLPVYFHVTTREWVDYNEAKQGVVTPDHPFFWTNFRRTANRECLDCHVTGLDVRYDRSAHTWSTNFTDAGVACESCHGPGARHSETKDPKDIVHPRKAGDEVGLAICAQCHGPRNPIYPILDAAHRFRPGDRYDDRYDIYVITSGRQLSGDFFPDGRPKSSSFEYQALLQSQCYRKGGATCLTCHTAPHAEHGPAGLKPAPGVDAAGLGDAGCRGCHAPVFAAGPAHTHHRVAPAQSCVACHMPRIIPGVLDLFADHALDVPAPQNSARHGIPNACNACHTKDSPDAMAAAIAKWWPGAAVRQARRLRLADGIDEAHAASSRPWLESVLSDASEAPSLKGASALLLAQRFPREASPALRPLLHDPDAGLRAKVVTALGMAGARDATSEIAPLIHDPSLLVRQAAALVLTAFGAPEGPAALQTLARDPATEGLVQPHVELGLAAARRGDFGAAEAELTRAAVLQPYNADVLVALSAVHTKQGRTDLARADAQEALRFDRQNPAAQQRLLALERGPRNP